VLVHFDFTRGYQKLHAVCPYGADEIPKRIATTDLVTRFETGLVEPRDFYEQFSRLLQLNIDYDRFCEIWSSIFTEALLPEAMLERLASRYRLLLLSNTNALHFDMIRGSYASLLKHFHDFILSYEVRAMKPNPAIFHTAVQVAGCAPQQCFYTDDIREYVNAARQLGIDAVQFESRDQLERELDARGINWR
jgi:putative hydrolase of the HAD superfamily